MLILNSCLHINFSLRQQGIKNEERGSLKQKFASVATLAVLALRSFPRKYNAGNIFICPQNLGFFKKKRAAEPPWRNENRGRSHTLRFICWFFSFQRPVKRTFDDGQILLRTEFQFVADTLSLYAFLPHDLWIEVPFYGESAHFDKLYDNR